MITILIVGRNLRVVASALIVGMLLVGCGAGGANDTHGVSVIATTSIWGDVAREIVGANGTVGVLVPVGSDPHDYRPSAGQVAVMNGADLVIANGLGLESGLQDVLEAATADGVNVYEVAPDVDPLPFHGTIDTGGEEQEPGDLDPHVWFDPQRVALAARAIADQLAEIEPNVDWASRAEAYVSELETLDGEIEELVVRVPGDRRKLITNHDSLGYFATRYGFEIVGVVIPGGSTLAAPSSSELAALVGEIERTGTPAIFAETTTPSILAEAVAAEIGEEVLVVELLTGSLGEAGSEAETLVGMLSTDAQLIVNALT